VKTPLLLCKNTHRGLSDRSVRDGASGQAAKIKRMFETLKPRGGMVLAARSALPNDWLVIEARRKHG